MKQIKSAGITVITAALLSAGCGSDSSDDDVGFADLVPTSVRELPCPGGCGPLRLEVCVENTGPADASSFFVTVNETNDASVDSLSSGAETCIDFVYRFSADDSPSVLVDSQDEVEELDELNNTTTFPAPSATRCDILCFDGASAPIPTPVPASNKS